MALSTADKDAIFDELESELSAANYPLAFGRADGRTAIDNADTWVNDNFNSAKATLPLSVRTDLNTKWLLRLYIKVFEKNWGLEL